MKFRLLLLGVLSVFITISILSTIVYAPLATLSTGYAITSNYEGIDVPMGSEVIITALTTDNSVDAVTFRWHEPPDGNGPIAREVTVPVNPSDDDYGTGENVYFAEDSYFPTILGDWGVQAFFQGVDGKSKSNIEDTINIKATSFNAIPEIPLGTIGATAAMIFAFGFFAVKKKKVET